MVGWYIYMVVLFAINIFILKVVISWRVEKIGWLDAFIIAIILTGAGAVAGMFLSPLLMLGVPAV